MAHYEFGFIGTGNMGGALARAAAKGVDPEQVLLADKNPDAARKLADALGCRAGTNADAAGTARFVVLGVKPQMMADMLAGIKDVLAARTDRFVLVTMAAGLSMAQITGMAGGEYPVIRIMPNMPVSVGAGMILLDKNSLTTDEEAADFMRLMAAAGTFDRIAEQYIDAGSAISGCGPAFAYLFIEALADGGVACGLSRKQAIGYACEMLRGSAILAAESGRHSAELKDAVCSPAGSTIAGVKALEEKAFRAACMDAVIRAYERTKELSR